jgi:hypothetical protein
VDCPGNLSLGQYIGDGKLDGETFLGRTWMFFFWGGRGRGIGIPGRRTAETFSEDDTSSKQPWVYVIYYMLSSGGFTAVCLQTITKGVLDPPLPWGDTCVVEASTTRRPSPHIEDGEGVVVARFTTDSTEQWV